MARKVFFSFYYDRDVRRVVQIRNSWVIRLNGEAQPFYDKAEWEAVRNKKGIERWIDEQLAGTSVTVVLIGSETYDREWVRQKSSAAMNSKRAFLAFIFTTSKTHNMEPI